MVNTSNPIYGGTPVIFIMSLLNKVIEKSFTFKSTKWSSVWICGKRDYIHKCSFFSKTFRLFFHDVVLADFHTEACLLEYSDPKSWKIRKFSVNCYCYRMADKWSDHWCLVVWCLLNTSIKHRNLAAQHYVQWSIGDNSPINFNRIWWKSSWLKHRFSYTSKRRKRASVSVPTLVH